MGLFRKCRLGHDIKLYHGSRFLPAVITEARKKGMKYFLVVDGVLVKQSRSLKIAENAYESKCKKKHKSDEKTTGRFKPFQHKLVNGVVHPRKG